MGKRRSNATDFDDWDLLDVFPEEEPKSRPIVTTQSTFDDDWAKYTPEELSTRRKKSRQKERNGKRGNSSGWKKIVVALAALAAVAALLVGIESVVSMLKWEPQNQAAIDTYPLVPDMPDTTAPVETVHQIRPVTTQPTRETMPAVTESDVESKEYRYYGSKLNATEKKAYDILATAFLNQQTRVEGIQLPSVESLHNVVEYVLLDHAELFWYDGQYVYWTYEKEGYIDFTLEPQYSCTLAERNRMESLVQSKIQGLLDELCWKSEYEKVKGVYEFLIDYSAYDYDYMGKTLYELFRDGRAVCDAYARATQYILTKLDVETIYLNGYAGSLDDMESHAWNIVKIDGKYYQIDTTWGDPYSEDGTQTKNFIYFCVTDDEMGRDHWASRDGYPACTATEHNYFVYEEKFLDWYNQELIKQWIREAEAQNSPMCFKMSSQQLYQEVKARLFDNQELFTMMEEALGEAVGYSYSSNDMFYIIKIEW